MEPLLIVLVPGVLGGVLIALFFMRVGGGPDGGSLEGRLQPPSTNVINMARIRVTGVGGLGMVAMAATVAIFMPRIRATMVVALVLGAALAAVLIAVRRREGALPSGRNPGAHAMFPLSGPKPGTPTGVRPPRDGARELAAIPAKP